MNEDLVTSRKAAELIGVNPETIRLWGIAGRIRRCVLGPRVVRYPLSDIENLIRNATAQAGGPAHA